MNRSTLLALAIVLATCALLAPQAYGQGAIGGVYVDAEGVLRSTAQIAPDERLELLRRHQAPRPPSEEIARRSDLRKVSLPRLAAAVQAVLDEGRALPDDLRLLAGLERIQYVFVYPPDTATGSPGDLVIAGPAAGWTSDAEGRVVSRDSGRPVLHLEDLAVALRAAFAPDAGPIGCSIEPTAEGVERVNAYVRGAGAFNRARAAQFFAGLEQAAGLQEVRIFGVPDDSRFALGLLAADVYLKRVAMGFDPPPLRDVPSYIDLAARAGGRAAAQLQHRFWFTADYDAIFVTPDRLAFELSGPGAQVLTEAALQEAESLAGDAEPDREARRSDPQAERFAELFSEHFTEIEARVPQMAELRNLIDLAVVAALIRADGLAERAGWTDPAPLLDPNTLAVGGSTVPTGTPSLVSYRLIGTRRWLISISGGVTFDPHAVASELQPAPDAANTAYTRDRSPPPPAGSWWWD